MAIVAITEEKVDCPKIEVANYYLLDLNNKTDKSNETCFKYNYDEHMTAQFLAAYFYGYALFMTPAGIFSEKFNCGK